MTDYISREAAEEIFSCGKENWKDYEAAACIAALPPADVRPVVLCGKCKYFSLNSCMRWADGTFMERTDFCSRGVKREES